MYKVTVGVLCYRQEEWLYRCLRSLADQTLSHDQFEVIIVNDNPGVDLEEICDVFEEDGILNLRLINNSTNLGVPSSLNRMLKTARGQYFVRVDADDYVSRHFLYVLSLYLDMNRDFQAVTCDYKKVNDVGISVSRHTYQDEPVACGVMFTYESLCNLKFYNESFKMREGHELMQRFKQRYKVCHLPFPLYRYRMHDANRTRDAATVDAYDRRLEEVEA